MVGYHRNRRATKNTVKEGWLHTGDVARYREDYTVLYCTILYCDPGTGRTVSSSSWTDSRSSSK